MSDRFYFRGFTFWGVLNTVLGAIFNRVIVRCIDQDTGAVVSWFWDTAMNHPPEAPDDN